jgi:hypothetical protein
MFAANPVAGSAIEFGSPDDWDQEPRARVIGLGQLDWESRASASFELCWEAASRTKRSICAVDSSTNTILRPVSFNRVCLPWWEYAIISERVTLKACNCWLVSAGTGVSATLVVSSGNQRLATETDSLGRSVMILD